MPKISSALDFPNNFPKNFPKFLNEIFRAEKERWVGELISQAREDYWHNTIKLHVAVFLAKMDRLLLKHRTGYFLGQSRFPIFDAPSRMSRTNGLISSLRLWIVPGSVGYSGDAGRSRMVDRNQWTDGKITDKKMDHVQTNYTEIIDMVNLMNDPTPG